MMRQAALTVIAVSVDTFAPLCRAPLLAQIHPAVRSHTKMVTTIPTVRMRMIREGVNAPATIQPASCLPAAGLARAPDISTIRR